MAIAGFVLNVAAMQTGIARQQFIEPSAACLMSGCSTSGGLQ